MMKPLLAILFTASVGGLALLSPLYGQDQPATAASEEDPTGESATIGFDPDRADRMTVAVNIGENGPYRFVVDTGAERTVIASELARRLNLGPGRMSIVHSMTEVSRVATVVIPELEVGGKRVRDINAPALQQRHLGAEGMLGVDSLQSQRVSFNFERQEMTITPSRTREERWPSDVIVVTARSRFGHLVLVDAAVDGQRVWVIIDTGSEVTVGNEALRRKLAKRRQLRTVIPIELFSVTGGRLLADATRVQKIRLGGIEVRDLPIAFADVHPFRKLDLLDRPALLLGMDALKLFERVSVDFANRRVKLLPFGTSGLEPLGRMAQAAPARPPG